MRGPVSEILDLPAITNELPAVPPAALDPYLDAGARCFIRHGVSHTAVPDVARELGVSRTTVYRQVGTVDHLARLLFAREVHRLLGVLPDHVAGVGAVDAVVRMATLVCTFAQDHPVLRKVLEDEPELAASALTAGLPAVLDRVRPVMGPLLAGWIAGGELAARDPDVLLDWLVRTVSSVVLVPPPIDVGAYFDEVLRPVLSPTGGR